MALKVGMGEEAEETAFHSLIPASRAASGKPGLVRMRTTEGGLLPEIFFRLPAFRPPAVRGRRLVNEFATINEDTLNRRRTKFTSPPQTHR
jgi:hypothetical protein